MSLETAAGNKHLGETTATGGAGTLAVFTAAQQAGLLLTTLRQYEAAYSRVYQPAYKHLRQLREYPSSRSPEMLREAGHL